MQAEQADSGKVLKVSPEKKPPQSTFHKKLFKSLDSRFYLYTSLKMCMVPMLSFAFTSFMIWIFMSMTHIFFESNGFLEIEALKEAFFDYVISDLLGLTPVVLGFFVGLFFLGNYLSHLLLRPFKAIGSFCQDRLEGKQVDFSPKLVMDLKLLTIFGMRFFNFLDESVKEGIKEGKYKTVPIEDRFAKIKRPVFDQVFYFHYVIVIIAICTAASLGLYVLSVELHQSIVQLAINALKTPNKSLAHFLGAQTRILYSVLTISISLMFILYLMLAYSMMKKINGVAYSFFVTMRSIMSGDKKARVFVRAQDPGHFFAHQFNQYMDKLFPS